MIKRKVLIVITTDFVPYGGLTTVMMNYYRVMNKENLQIDFACAFCASYQKIRRRNRAGTGWDRVDGS